MNIQKLHKIGFSLILLQPKKKQPLDDAWNRGPKVPLFDILEGVEHDKCNVGFRPGITSKTQDGRFIHGVDLDIRIEEDREEAIAKLEELFGRKFLKSCPCVKSGSGGSSRHFYFTLRRPLRAKTVAHSKEKFLDPKTNRMRWRWEIEVFGEGKQMVLPPSIHPDTGNEYEWRKEPEDTLPAMEEGRLDDILDELTRRATDFDDEDLKPLGMEYDDAEDVLEKLDFQKWFVERQGWLAVGMALHHEFKGSKGAYQLWTKYSKKSEIFDSNEQRYQWSTFGRNTHVRPVRMATLMKDAKEAEIRAALQPDENEAEEIRESIREAAKRKEKKREYAHINRKKTQESTAVVKTERGSYRIKQPKHLMTVPGILGDVVDLFNRSAVMPSPQFAVHTALAVGSVILGRNWKSDMRNYTSMYFLVLGGTATGKEHCYTVAKECLMQAELPFVGPSKYTSDAGMFTALEMKPKHMTITDEFSAYLKSARSSGDSNKADAQTSLMEAWGRLHGVLMNKAYSGRNMTKEQLESMSQSKVIRPALTMLAGATPDDFYNAMSDADVASGFLNRFLVCENEIPRQLTREKIDPIEISPRFKKWARENAFPVTDDDDDIMDAINRGDPLTPGEAIEVPFTPAAKKLLRQVELQYLTKMEELDEIGLGGLHGRVREIIMRLSLIVARSCESDEIRVEHVEWARDYTEYHAAKFEDRAVEDMGASENQKILSMVYSRIDEASRDDRVIGLTQRDLITYCKPYRNLDTRSREEIAKLLASDYGVVIRQVKRPGKRQSVKVFTTRDEE